MESLTWESVNSEFAFDGRWRDIYILDTDIAAWQRMLDGLIGSGYEISYFRDERPTVLPDSAEEAFPAAGRCDRKLGVHFRGILANCHFFEIGRIEFDIDPREVVGQSELDGLFAFMRCLAESVGRDAIFCPEDRPEIAIFRVSPGISSVEHQAFGGWHDWRQLP